MLVRGDENPFLRGKASKKHINAAFSEIPNPFTGLSEADRLRGISEFASAHAGNYTSSLHRLREICRNYNFFQLLAHFGYYDQLVLDTERNYAGYKPTEQSSVELLQALILQIPESELSLRLETPPPPEILLETNRLLGGIIKSFSLKRFGSRDGGRRDAGMLSEIIRSHTAAVRNEGFPSQIRRTMIELVEPLDSAFEGRQGLKLSHLATMLWRVLDVIEKRLNDDFQQRMKVLRSNDPDEMISKFLQFHCIDDNAATEFRANVKRAQMSLRDLQAYLISIWDSGNFKLFSLSVEDWIAAYPVQSDISRIQWVLSMWSLQLGSLSSADPEHFFLENPVWSKPIIHFGPDHFFLALPSMVQSFGQQLLESLIQTESDLWDKYQSKVRPKFLERFVERLFRNAFPSAKVLAGVHWKEPKSGQLFETDLLVTLDTHALIVECKAGRITARARRGDIARLEKDVGKLIEEPTLQGQRFASLLLRTEGSLEVEDSRREKHVIDAKRLVRIARINVTLDYFGPVGIQARMLREAGMVSKDLEPAATFHIHELESAAEILDRPSQLFHYLQRRAEIEAAHDLLADEGSLLAMYLATGFDLGDLEDSGHRALALPEMGESLNPYFMGKELNRRVSKPRRRLTGWWNDMLLTLEKRGAPGWMEMSYGLLSVGYTRQKEFERWVKKMLREVKSNWRDQAHRNVCFLVAGAREHPVTVMCVGVKNVSLQEQRDTVTRAFHMADEKVPTAGTVAIVKSASTKTYPYSAVYLLRGAEAV